MTVMVKEERNTRRRIEPKTIGPERRLYYGWVMLPLALAALVASSPGQTFGVAIFNEPIRNAFGLTHGQLSAAYTLGTLLGALPIAFIGHQMDRHGLRRTLLVVVTLFSAACVLTSFVQGWVSLTLAFCLLRMLGPGALGFLSGNTLSFWFERRLGMVEGIRQVGMASAIALVPMLNLWLVTTWGWRSAYAMLGVGIWLLLFPTFLILLKNRPEDVGQSLDNLPTFPNSTDGSRRETWWGFTLAETLRMPSFWIVTTGTAMFSLIHTAVFFSLVPIIEERGLSQHDAAAMLTVFAVCLAAMQLTSGTLSDRLPAPILLTAGLLGLAVSMVLLNWATSPGAALVTGAAMGTSQGIFFGASHPLWARYFGRRHLGKIRGVLMTINVASSSLGPLLAGVTRDVYGSFSIALVVFAVAPLPIAVLSWFATAPGREEQMQAPLQPHLAAAEAT